MWKFQLSRYYDSLEIGDRWKYRRTGDITISVSPFLKSALTACSKKVIYCNSWVVRRLSYFSAALMPKELNLEHKSVDLQWSIVWSEF
jgi:hypothetical protein